ncbi:hypothetical protein SAMN05444008_11293 [Cnuella takakiae]|uniref:Uncharacterized protein n=1 Tax=Cnuella takakiae TaxID=1302690 RepID=A0A1M5ELD7_9BACT|nr:hypothetical protein [Cnuella takakiae]OLY91219.1 hypothetical protein BUE76_04365 [Cnuella takakiae]SHF80025.1 hypothetical protein SAMN05444008_11293 [Cnuella takakiae]
MFTFKTDLFNFYIKRVKEVYQLSLSFPFDTNPGTCKDTYERLLETIYAIVDAGSLPAIEEIRQNLIGITEPKHIEAYHSYVQEKLEKLSAMFSAFKPKGIEWERSFDHLNLDKHVVSTRNGNNRTMRWASAGEDEDGQTPAAHLNASLDSIEHTIKRIRRLTDEIFTKSMDLKLKVDPVVEANHILSSVQSSNQFIKLNWLGQKNQIYQVLRKLKQDGLIGNSYNELADFLIQNVVGFHNTKKETVEKELKRGDLPKKGKRIDLDPE